MAKIFWVEDHTHWVDKFSDILITTDFDGQDNDLQVFRFSEAACQEIALTDVDNGPDIAILDATMNGNDQAGFSVSSALLRKWPSTPIIFLSEHNGTEIEKDALEHHHALDFISKHQRNVEEVLCWRIKAALRQARIETGEIRSGSDNLIISGDLKIDLDTWEVYWRNTKVMNPDNARRPLAPTPRKILRCLVECSPRPVTTWQIAEALETDPDRYADATYRQHIKTLRRAFNAVSDDFMELCKSGYGIVTCGEEGAYYWKPHSRESQA